MQLGGLSFSVSPEARRQAENELIVEAIAAFKARAEIVRAALAGRGYKIQRLNVNSGHSAPPPRFAMARGLGRRRARGGRARFRGRGEPGHGQRRAARLKFSTSAALAAAGA